eukprot:Clim_evm53s235 gene=Clim_evmTU53s235
MLRRRIRERKEYLYRKSLEDTERQTLDRKRMIKEAIREGKAIPTELRAEEQRLREEIELEDEGHNEPRSIIDDEYAKSNYDPNVVVTTSRDPSSKLKQFAKEIRLLVPNSRRINRGNYVMKDLVETCTGQGITDLIILHEHRGVPDGMIVSHLPMGPTAYFSLSNVVMRHDVVDLQGTTVSERYPHLIFEGIQTRVGKRIQQILTHLFPIPSADSDRTLAFVNKSDFITFRHHNHKKDKSQIELFEVGPRFDLKPYRIALGTVDALEADDEWVSRPYMRTARKRREL